MLSLKRLSNEIKHKTIALTTLSDNISTLHEIIIKSLEDPEVYIFMAQLDDQMIAYKRLCKDLKSKLSKYNTEMENNNLPINFAIKKFERELIEVIKEMDELY